jgi:methionyl-tRNA formyltransferase
MSDELDAGPVYLKQPLSLEGGAEEIYMRATRLSAEMMGKIIGDGIQPTPQVGEPTYFLRRRPEESLLPELETLDEVHDFIRMLDAEGYPKAFLDVGRFRVEFGGSVLYNCKVTVEASFRVRSE